MRQLIKKIYEFIPFKRQVFSLIKWGHLPESIYKHLHFKGIFTVKIDTRHYFKMYHLGVAEENELFWAGIDRGWEKTSLKIWRKLCVDANVVLDIGANTGLYSLVTKALNPTAKVYAFEPLPKVLEYLNYNVEINNFDIKVIPKAVSNFIGNAKVFLREEEEFSYSVTVNKSLLAETTPQKELAIETLRLDDFIQQNKITSINLIKVDVETHEPEVIEGMGEYLDKYKPDFLIEIWDKECALKLANMFKNKGYVYFDIDDKNDVVTQKEEITISSYWNYLICKPASAKKLGLI